MAGLYFHIPFCRRVCAYCDFFKSARLGDLDAVLEAMDRELETAAGWLSDRHIRTVYFGGGTPSLCRPEQLQRLVDKAATLLDLRGVEEFTVEANPDDLTAGWLDALARETGANRLSIGIQSFDDDELKLMNRRHTAAQAVEAVRRAQAAGFSNITIDLIFGVAGFGGEVLRHNLDQALALGVPHISAYHLTIEPDTLFGRRAGEGKFLPVEEGTSEEEFRWIHDTLTAAGYEHYEVSNYALPGHRARHNAAYWSGEPYLGIGPAAHSFNGTERRWSAPSIENYPSYQAEILSETDRYNEYLMTRLRTCEGVDLHEIETRFGTERRAHLEKQAAPYEIAGTLRRSHRSSRTGHRLAIPPESFLISDAVIAALFETA